MKKLSLFLAWVCFALTSQAQLTQNIRGKVIDQQSEAPLIGANIVVLNSDPFVGASTDLEGNYRLENVPVGRHSIQVSYLGYENRIIPNVLLTSGKELVLNIPLTESFQSLDEVVISGATERGESINKMATVSARTFSVEETKRYAGSVDDPSRLVSGYAGVGAVDGENDLVIRGNSPRGMLWRMEGIEIPNPNHFSNQGSSGGPISMLNSNMMANSEFYTGAFPAEYGNAFSGVFDINLRQGNNEQREYAFKVGLLGTDFSAEGPFSKKYNGSYLINYRYSTLAVFSLVGLDIVGDIVPKFQDLSYNISLPTKKLGNFTAFGLLGSGTATDEWDYDGYRYDDIFRTDMGVVGLKHAYLIGSKTVVKTVAAGMATQRSYYENTYDSNLNFIRESYREEFLDPAFRVNSYINHKFNARNTLRVGGTANFISYDYYSQYEYDEVPLTVDQDANGSTQRYEGFAQWQYRPFSRLTLNTGLHYTHFTLNQENRVEPRFGARLQLDEKSSINLGFGQHSKTWDLALYNVQVSDGNGGFYKPNLNLKMLQATHYVLGYDRFIGNDLKIKVEAYYQSLNKVPIAEDPNSIVSALNSQSYYPEEGLNNKGTGENYGLEFTAEKFFTNQWYGMVTSSLYNSTYVAADGKERNTLWNANYITNFQGGKEFYLGSPKRVLSLNLKFVWAGGNRAIPIDLEKSKEVGYTQRDFDNAYNYQMRDYLRLDSKISYRINSKKATHTIMLDIQNTTNRENHFNEYFDSNTGKIENNTMLGILPILSYKIQF